MFGLSIESVLKKIHPKTKAFHWEVKLSREGKSYTFRFTKGSAHVGRKVGGSWRLATRNELFDDENRIIKRNGPIPPYLEEVLECLQSNVSDFQTNISYKEWAGNLGYGTDSIKGKKIFRKCRKLARKIQALLGSEYESFLRYNSW